MRNHAIINARNDKENVCNLLINFFRKCLNNKGILLVQKGTAFSFSIFVAAKF